MIIEEETTIILDNGVRYLLLEELGEIDGYPGKTYYYAAGITKNDKINTNDICFVEIEKENNEVYATKVKKDSELYEILASLEAVSLAIEENPKLISELEQRIEELSE